MPSPAVVSTFGGITSALATPANDVAAKNNEELISFDLDTILIFAPKTYFGFLIIRFLSVARAAHLDFYFDNYRWIAMTDKPLSGTTMIKLVFAVAPLPLSDPPPLGEFVTVTVLRLSAAS
jgi:hypothetical protein